MIILLLPVISLITGLVSAAIGLILSFTVYFKGPRWFPIAIFILFSSIGNEWEEKIPLILIPLVIGSLFSLTILKKIIEKIKKTGE